MTITTPDLREALAEALFKSYWRFNEFMRDRWLEVDDETSKIWRDHADAALVALESALVAKDAEIKDWRARLMYLVARQAEDDGLWFIAQTAPEAYLQQELRRLHAAIEE